MSDLLSVNDLTVEYGVSGRRVKALDCVNLAIPSPGYSIGVVGESGSGKTTLAMSIMAAIENPGKITNGKVIFEDKDVFRMNQDELRHYRWERVSMVYQSAMNSLNPTSKVRDPIAEVLSVHQRTRKKEAQELAKQLLSEVGIKEQRILDYPHEFSGGMKQRVVIALALALSPTLLIADEPTSALDVVTQSQILSLIKRQIQRKKLSLLFITHEISILRGVVDNLALMYSGEVVEVGPQEDVIAHPLHPYTEMLLGTLLTLESSNDMLKKMRERVAVKGYGMSTYSSKGCKYVSRCKYAFSRCREEKPLLREAEKGRYVACHKYN